MELEDFELIEIQEALERVANSYSVSFAPRELENVTTLGELLDKVKAKANFVHVEDCTNQQAFYKLREAVEVSMPHLDQRITLDFPLAKILGNRRRRRKLSLIEKQLGFKLEVLAPSMSGFGYLGGALVSLFVAIGHSIFLGIAVSIVWTAIIYMIHTPETLQVSTVRECIDGMVRQHYAKCRRVPGTANETEVDRIFFEIFATELGLETDQLRRVSRIRRQS